MWLWEGGSYHSERANTRLGSRRGIGRYGPGSGSSSRSGTGRGSYTTWRPTGLNSMTWLPSSPTGFASLPPTGKPGQHGHTFCHGPADESTCSPAFSYWLSALKTQPGRNHQDDLRTSSAVPRASRTSSSCVNGNGKNQPRFNSTRGRGPCTDGIAVLKIVVLRGS